MRTATDAYELQPLMICWYNAKPALHRSWTASQTANAKRAGPREPARFAFLRSVERRYERSPTWSTIVDVTSTSAPVLPVRMPR
jgi:hypothetical protein